MLNPLYHLVHFAQKAMANNFQKIQHDNPETCTNSDFVYGLSINFYSPILVSDYY